MSEAKSWTFLYSCLAKACAPVLLCVLDTIIFSATTALRPVYWVYTDQDHCVRRKSIAKLTLDDVIQACAAASSSNSKLSEDKVCFLISRQGRKLVSLLQLWNVRMRAQEEWLEGVQLCSVAGRPLDECVYFQTWSGKQTGAVTKRLLEAYYTEETASTEEELNQRIEEATKTVLAAMETAHGSAVLHLRLSYLVERGNLHSDARIPWLLFSENCVMSPSPPAPSLVAREPDAVPETPSLLQSTGLRSTVSGLMNKQDARLAVVTLSPVHFPQVANRPKPLPDSHHRPSPNRSKRTAPRPSLSRPLTRGGSTSHSCILPSSDMEQADLTVLPASYSSNIVSPGVEIRTHQVAEKTEVSLQAILQREQAKTYSPRMKISHRDVGTPAPEEELADRLPHSRERQEETLPAVLESSGRKAAGGSRAESPDIKYLPDRVARINLSDYMPQRQPAANKRSTSLSVRVPKKSRQARQEVPPEASLNSSVLLDPPVTVSEHYTEKFSRGEKCKGDFCSLGLIKLPNIDLMRRFAVKAEIVALGKMVEYSPLRRPEIVIPPSDLILRLESDFKSLHAPSLPQTSQLLPPAKAPAPVHSYFELLREERLYEDIRKLGEKTYSQLVQINRKQIFYLPSASVCFSNLNLYPLKISSFANEPTANRRSDSPVKVSNPLKVKTEAAALGSGVAGKKVSRGESEVPVCFRCFVIYLNISILQAKQSL